MNINLIQFSLSGGSPMGGLISFEQLKRLYWQIRHRSNRVRFSISALVRIQIDDEYLLIRGNRANKNRFQPVGGVLKFYESARHELEQCGLGPDVLYAVDDDNRNDLRIMLSGKKLRRFLSWYETGLGREQSPWREFWEEMVGPSIVPQSLFPHAHFQFLRRHSTGINWSDHINGYECRIAEIYELVPSPEQESNLRSTKLSGHSDLLWVDAESIRARGIKCKSQTEERITDTSAWLLPE